jgi:hypothetical protein
MLSNWLRCAGRAELGALVLHASAQGELLACAWLRGSLLRPAKNVMKSGLTNGALSAKHICEMR